MAGIACLTRAATMAANYKASGGDAATMKRVLAKDVRHCAKPRKAARKSKSRR